VGPKERGIKHSLACAVDQVDELNKVLIGCDWYDAKVTIGLDGGPE
jgi:hypothetical protein